MAFVRHLQVTLQSATFMDPVSSFLDERMVYVKASHPNIVYTTNVVEGIGNVELHHMWGNDGTNVFHFAYEDNSEDIALELFNRDHICIGMSRLHLAGLAKVTPEQDPELKTLPVSALGGRWSYGSLTLTAQIKRQQAMGKLGNLNVVLQEGIINSISSTEPRVFAKLIYKHITYTVGILRGERNKFVWHEHFTFRINSWDPVDVLEICIYYGAFQVGECKVLLSLFINLEEDLQADRKAFVMRTEDLLVDKRSVGSIKVAGSFSTLHELEVLREIAKGKRPELYPARIPPPESPGLTNYTSITNEIRGEGKLEADIFHTDKSKPEVQLEFREIWNAGKPTSIGDYLPIDLTRDLLGASSRGYVIRTICPDGQGGRYSCALKRINTVEESEPDLARLCHPHVVHLFHHWKEKIDYGEVCERMPKSAFMTFLMMELMDGDLGNLMTSIKTTGLTPFSLPVAVHMMLQIAKGMLYLHEMGVSHPHLKCNNVLCRVKSTAQIPFRVGDVLVKLGGFGCSRAANDDTKNRDVFCFGLTCLEVLTGDECFEDVYGADKVSRPSIPETTPCILKDCIASCLDTKITFSEAITLLLLAQSQIIQTCEEKMILCSVNPHMRSTLSNNQDLASSSTSKSDRQEMFHVHQLHPQLGEVATSVQITLIFFHGFPKVSEEWRMTWLTRDNRLVWPQMWLPEDLDGDIRVLSVSFDDRPNVSSSQSIKDLLQILVTSATCKLGDTDQAILLVGHSFGGVIIKALVAAAQGLAGKTVENNVEFQEVLKCKKFLKRLASIVFYSVPHAFTNMEFENYISGCSNTRVLQRSFLLKALCRDSVFISNMIQLSRDFENAVPPKTKLLAFLEGKPMNKKSLLVTENSWEGLLLSWEWHKIDRDNHFEVCRPVSKSHIGYKVLLNHLQQHMCSPSAVNKRGELKRMMGKYEDALEDLNKANDLEPNVTSTLVVQAEVKIKMGKYVDALEDLNKADELEPNVAFTLASRGEMKKMMGKYVDALEDLNRANELDPNVAFTLRSRGEVKVKMGNYVHALEDLNKVDELEPNVAFTLRSRGEVKRMMRKYASALEDLNKAHELEPNDAFTLRTRGEVKKMMRKYASALEDLNKAHELEPNDAFTLRTRGEVKRMMCKYASALEDLNKAHELEPNDAFTLATRGEVKRLMNKYADALEDLNKAHELEPNNAFTLRTRGEVKRLMNRYANALEDLNKAHELQPNNVFTLRTRGEVKRLMNKYANALEDLKKAHELEPNNAFILRTRGEVKRLMNKYANALEDLKKAHELEPNDAFTLATRGEVKRLMNKYADALEDLNKAHELEPNNAFILRTRGEVKRLMNRYVDALEDLNKAHELQPNNVFTLRTRGEVKRLMNKNADALEDLNKAHELQPNNVFILRTRGEVKRLMNKYADALEDLNKAHELQPNDAFTLRSCGEVKRKMDKYTNALDDLNKANDLEPNEAFTLRSRRDVKRKMGMYVDALEDLNKAYELKPNVASTLRSRGEVKRLMGMYVDALEDFNKAYELEPNVASILRSRGEVKRLMGKNVDALEDLSKAHELEPNDAFTLAALQKVKKMMGKYIDVVEDLNKAHEIEPNVASNLAI